MQLAQLVEAAKQEVLGISAQIEKLNAEELSWRGKNCVVIDGRFCFMGSDPDGRPKLDADMAEFRRRRYELLTRFNATSEEYGKLEAAKERNS
jgi:hypothetical protein